MRNLKRALSLAMASVMLLGLMVVGAGAASYPDVDAQDNLEAIEVLKAVGIMTGDDKGNFNPDQNVTRNEMAVVMVNLLNLKTGSTVTPFTDVPAWAAPYVAACYNNGVVAGTSATTYGGSANVTAVQASLMIMKALGYFGYQGEFGDDWQVATVKQANKIDLYNGVNAGVVDPMNRSEIAQLVLNALECTVTVVEQIGGLKVDGNGITVVENPTYRYTDAVNNSGKDYLGRGSNKTMELCEKLYGNDLKKNGDTVEDFGRPATKWTYGTSTITTPKSADLTYTEKVKGKAIYEDLGKVSGITLALVDDDYNSSNADVAGYIVDGKNIAAGSFAITSGNSVEIGGKGTLTEVYFDKDTKVATVVCINTYLAKADGDFDKDDEEVDVTISSALLGSATLSSDDFAVASVEEDDYLLVNLSYNGSDYEVKGVSFPTVIENATVSSARANDYVVADGTKYVYSTVSQAAASGALGQSLMAGTSYSINDDGYNLYLDSYGYVVGVEGYDAGVNLDDYLFVKQVSTNGFDVIVKALFMDGTTKTVVVDKIGSTDVTVTGQVAANKFYKFDTDKDGNYELTTIATGAASTVVMQNTATSTITSKASPVSGAPSGTSETVFIAKDKTFTGVKNAPEVASGTVYYLTNDKGRLMVVYTAQTGSSKTSSDDLVYILNGNPAKAKDGDDTYYIYNAIVNGEKTTLDANQNSKPAGVYKLGTYTDGRADLDTALNTVNGDALVHILGDISTPGADYADGTLILGSNGYLLADNAKILTIDGNTVKAISASGVKKAVATDGFKYAAAIEVSSSNDDIVTVYLSKTAFGVPSSDTDVASASAVKGTDPGNDLVVTPAAVVDNTAHTIVVSVAATGADDGDTIVVTATAANGNASVSGTATLTRTTGTWNAGTITITAEDGTTQAYAVTVTEA